MPAKNPPPVLQARSQDLTQAFYWLGSLTFVYLLLWQQDGGFDLGLGRFLPLHAAMETASIIVSMLVFGIAWNAYSHTRPGNVVLLGTVLLGTALLDFGHMFGYGGMPDFVTPSSPQKAIVFWLAARALVAVGLLITATRAWQPMLHRHSRYSLLVAVCGYVGAVYWLELFNAASLPVLFVQESGLTQLKIDSEYVLIVLYGLAATLFYRQARRGVAHNAADLFAAAAIAALSELCFTLYASVSDIFNFAGHIYKVISYGFIYRAVFVDSVRQPFAALNRALAKEKLWAAEQHSFVRTLDMLDEAVLELQPDGRIASANSGWWHLTGNSPGGAPLAETIYADDRSAFLKCLGDLQNGRKDEFHGRFRIMAEAAYEQWMECRFVAERDDEGQLIGIRGVLRDITKTYLQERHIAHMALHDALTGLPNRVLLEDRIKKTVQLARRTDARVAVCFIDLDHFKNINDAYGHKTGDALLLGMAKTLEKSLRDGDTIARWGGDEFVALLPGLTSAEDARNVARKLVSVMQQTYELEGQPINATFSMGISLFPDDSDSVDTLLAHADRAMFYAKSQGRNNFQLFSDMSARGLGKKELYIQSRLAQAIRDGHITSWFQPQFAATPDATGQRPLTGAEALARWHDADLGWISPGTFIPMAETLGLIHDLGQLVRRQALEQFARWYRLRPDLQLSLNISKRQLFAPDFVDTLLADAGHYGLPAAALILEVTESVALMEVECAEERLRQLVQAGFTLSIDDFGTGYASLSQLHELPVGELKVDISFVQRVHTPDGLRILQAIVNLARALGLRTVAEGVEDEATASTLMQLEVDVLQGYHLGKPCPAEDFEKLPFFAGNPAAGLALPANC